jgi:hypothetical protein
MIGLLFLSLDPKTTNGLVRVLLSTENDEDYSEMPTLNQYTMSSELAEQCSPYHLGILLVFHLQSLHRIDHLLGTVKPGTCVFKAFENQDLLINIKCHEYEYFRFNILSPLV